MRRQFRGLREPPKAVYDAVVVGAGVGGLVCANLLARAGLSVLLIEQHFMVGGYCSTFRRGGYTFDAATHFYPLLGNPSTITGGLLGELGITTRWVKMDPVDRFHLPDGSSFAVPAAFASYIRQLTCLFPDQTDQLNRFFDFVRKVYLLGLACYFRDVPTSRLHPYQHLTLAGVLDEYFQNPKLKLLLTGDIGHWGSPPSRTSFVFDSMLRLAYFLGNYYPVGGSQAFVDQLAQRFEEAGGHILMSSCVRRILTYRGTACGVQIEIGRPNIPQARVFAGAIISNADLRHTLVSLIGPAQIDPDYLLGIARLRRTYSCFLLHLGLKGISPDDLKTIEGYHWSSWDAEEVATHAFKVFLPTLFDPSMAPPGGAIAIIQKVTDVDYAAVEDWQQHKAQIEQRVLGTLETRLPGFASKILVKLSASAHTSQRYTLNCDGAMLGWEMSPDQIGDHRPQQQGPLNNLYFVGHWTRPGGGITPVMISAMRVASMVTGNRTLTRLMAGKPS